MSDLRLTDLTQATGITINDLLHIVITGDTSQDPAGSSYKASIEQLYDGLSGYCIPDLYVSNLHSCSPLLVNPNDEGNVYFGSTSGITLDLPNKRIGINTNNPQYTLDIKESQSNLYYDPTSVGGRLTVSGTTNLPRFGVEIPPYLTKLQATMSIGMRAWDDSLYPDYGKQGDAHLYAGVNANGLNIISEYGVTSEDYIRFYAGQDANGTTPDVHIQGTGTTRGYIGIGTINPSEKLHISGNTNISGGLSANTISATTFNLSGSQIESAWTSYVPTWTASVNPAINNGTIEGYYKLIGKTCFVRGNIAMGSTTTYGTGEWLVGLPFPAKNADGIQMTVSILQATVAWYNGIMNGARAGFTNRTAIQYQNTGGTTDSLTSSTPFVWGAGSRFTWNGSYEIA
jgi:hypothetical protein